MTAQIAVSTIEALSLPPDVWCGWLQQYRDWVEPTTEGALVRSYERGMVTLSRAGGVFARVYVDENRISPTFFFDEIRAC